MKVSNLILISVVIALGVTGPLFIRHRAEVKLAEEEQTFQKQSGEIAELSAENQRRSNVVAQVEPTSSSDATLTDLLRLRNEVTQLGHVPEEMENLRQKIARLKERLQDAAEEESYGATKNTALLAEETHIRQARVVRMKRWLEENSDEKIPEMQFVSESRWTDRADRPLVSDDDYRSAIGLLRADGEQRFVPMIYKAVKGYAKANNDQFPSELSQLKAYFEKPIDDAILERWTIVPAKSLVPFLAETGGDWLITEKAPINKQFDSRSAIGLTSYRGTVGEGRWDPTQ